MGNLYIDEAESQQFTFELSNLFILINRFLRAQIRRVCVYIWLIVFVINFPLFYYRVGPCKNELSPQKLLSCRLLEARLTIKVYIGGLSQIDGNILQHITIWLKDRRKKGRAGRFDKYNKLDSFLLRADAEPNDNVNTALGGVGKLAVHQMRRPSREIYAREIRFGRVERYNSSRPFVRRAHICSAWKHPSAYKSDIKWYLQSSRVNVMMLSFSLSHAVTSDPCELSLSWHDVE